MNHKLIHLSLIAALLFAVPAEAYWSRFTAMAVFENEARKPHPKRIRHEVLVTKRIPRTLDDSSALGPSVSYHYTTLNRQYQRPNFDGRFEVVLEHWRGDTLLFIEEAPTSSLPINACFWVEFPPGYDLRKGDLFVARVRFHGFPHLRAEERLMTRLEVEAPGGFVCN